MTNTKAMLTALSGLLAVMLVSMPVAAQTDDQNSDSITIRITPNIDFGVDIDSGTPMESGGGLIDLGSVDLYVATQTVRPATVTILGNLASAGANTGQELDVSGQILGAGGWSFDLTPSTWATSGENDALATYIMFSDTSLSLAPDGDDFAAAGNEADFTGTTLRAGGAGATNGGKFELGATEMDDLSPNDERHMWFFFRLPNNTSNGNANDIQITLTAVNASS